MADTTGNDDELLRSYFAAALAGAPSRAPLLQRPQPIIPQTGAGSYFYVDPRAQQGNVMPHPLNGAMPVDHAELLKTLQLLPPDAQKILMNLKALPRFAGDRSDLNDILNSSPETQFLGKPGPTPKPTPTVAPKYFPISYFT